MLDASDVYRIADEVKKRGKEEYLATKRLVQRILNMIQVDNIPHENLKLNATIFDY